MNSQQLDAMHAGRVKAAAAKREAGIRDVVEFRNMLVRDRELRVTMALRHSDGASVEQMTKLRVERSALWANMPHTTDASWQAAREAGVIA